MKPIISIGIPTYNRYSYLKKCIESCLNQKNSDNFLFQIIVSNNCSSDETARYLNNISCKKYDNIVFDFVNHVQEISPMQNWNACLKKAKSDFFILLSDDDLLDVNFISVICDSINAASDDVSGLVSGFEVINEKGHRINTYMNHSGEVSGDIYLKNLAQRKLKYRWCAFISRTKILRNLHVFEMSFPGSGMFADGAGIVSCCDSGSIICIQSPLVRYRVHAGNDCRRPDIDININGRDVFIRYVESSIRSEYIVQWTKYWCADGYSWQSMRWFYNKLLDKKMMNAIYKDMSRIDNEIDWKVVGWRSRISYELRKSVFAFLTLLKNALWFFTIQHKKMEFHQTYKTLEKAVDLSNIDAIIIPLPTIWPPRAPFFPKTIISIIERILSVATHYRLILSVMKNRKKDMIIIREFSNIPMLLVWPFLTLLNNEIYCLVNHNIQLATRNRFEKFAIKTLSRLNCKFLCLEGVDGTEESGIIPNGSNILTLPFPIKSLNRNITRVNNNKLIGIVGRFRKEKGVDELLNVLHRARTNKALDVDILLGCPDKEYLKLWNIDGIRTIDTTTSTMYKKAMDSCDIIIFNYDIESYYFRHSGVISDAISDGKIVVCPNYPLLKKQITIPEIVGFTFDQISELPTAVISALELAEKGAHASFQAHYNLRNPKKVANLLNLIITNRAVNEK